MREGIRLTARNEDGTPYYPECFNGDCDGLSEKCADCPIEAGILETLCRYEKEEENRERNRERKEEFEHAVVALVMIVMIIAAVIVTGRF